MDNNNIIWQYFPESDEWIDPNQIQIDINDLISVNEIMEEYITIIWNTSN